jgi:hypothetical protein
MSKYFKLENGDRVRVISGDNAGREGTIDFNRHVHYYILLDGETRPANVCGREFYLSIEYKKNLIKL